MPHELPTKDFVAFSFSGTHRDLMRGVAEAVERQLGPGSVFFDEWFEYVFAGIDADLTIQRIFGERCDLAVVCVSDGIETSPWRRAEYDAIRSRYRDARHSSEDRDRLRILPIRVGDGDGDGMFTDVAIPDVRGQSAQQIANLIVERLRLIQSEGTRKGAGLVADDWPDEPPVIRWPVANQFAVRDAFSALLTRDPTFRILLLSGASESGKSHITRQMLAAALRMPDVACGRFDFKGTTDIDGAVRVLAGSLDVPLPPEHLSVDQRLIQLVMHLERRARPTLLLFDTYEAAGQIGDWVESQLLNRLVRTRWLRVVIAGQRVPNAFGAAWTADATQITLSAPAPADWFDYARPHHPEVTLDMVEQFCRLAHNKASLLAQLLGPAN